MHRILIPALLAAALGFHLAPPPRPPSLLKASDADLAAFSLNDLKTLAAARGIDVSGMTEKAQVADALKACKGREIACMHDLALDFLAHESLFRAFVVLASRPRARLWVTHSLYLSINHYISCHVISLPNLHNSHTTLGRG